MKFIYIAVCISLLISISCYASDSSLKCFDRFVNVDLPFEIYSEDFMTSCKKFIQPPESNFGLSAKGIPLIECADETTVAPLCDGNFITVWKFSHHRFPIPLTGRIINNKFNALGNDFPISENNNLEEWEHSVSTLYDGGFVVTWKTWKTNSRKEIKLRGRIFDNNGNPKGHSFDVSNSKGDNNGGFVYGLPNGNFVVLWHNSKAGALLRIFDKKGTPKTQEILIIADSGCFLKPRAYITKNYINIFMTCQSMEHVKKYFFRTACSFTHTGKQLSCTLKGESIQSLEGYSHLLEQHVKEYAQYYDLRLRKFKKEFKERNYCHGELLIPNHAFEMKKFTNDLRIKKFFTDYCMEYKKSCIIQTFEEKALEQCLQE